MPTGVVQSFCVSNSGRGERVKRRLMMGRRLFIALMVMVEAVCVLIGLAFYAYNVNTVKQTEKARLASLCANAASRIDNMVRSMDELSVGITIADGFIPAMRLMSSDAEPAVYVDTIRSIMVKAYASKSEVYRIIVLAENGNTVSLGRNELHKAETSALVRDGYWRQSDRRGTSKVLVGPLSDPWVKDNPQQIFSLLRAVREGDALLGYIEVQMQTSRLQDAFVEKWRYNNLYYGLIDGNNDRMFFTNFGEAETERYLSFIIQNAGWYPTDSIEYRGELISISSSNYTDWKTAMVMPGAEALAPIRNFLPLALCASLLMGAVIALFFKLVVDRITKPMARVVQRISEIELRSLDAPFTRETSSYEAEVLSEAFDTMKTRLADAFRQQKNIERLQTKVLLEALQSRIGPHFLNNTLGSIANMCTAGDAEGAADACYSLSELLRYSSQQGSDEVTIRQELEHLQDYLLLMKARYRHRLSYEIHADERCMDTRILKLTIQPLVENAIKYSLSEKECVLVGVDVAQDGGDVLIVVSDNGMGFDASVQAQIEATVSAFQSDPSRFSVEEFTSKRGLGLVGTLLRLYLLLGDAKFHYAIRNGRECGAEIELRIGAREE